MEKEKKTLLYGLLCGFAGGAAAAVICCAVCCGCGQHGGKNYHDRPGIEMRHSGQHKKLHAPNGGLHDEAVSGKKEALSHAKHKRHGGHPDMRANPDGRLDKDGGRKALHGEKPWAEGKRLEPTAEMKARFAEKLKLTDEQKAALDKMRAEDMAKMEPLTAQIKQARSELRALRQNGRERFESLLTDEQKEILKNMRPDDKADRGEFKSENPAAPGADEM